MALLVFNQSGAPVVLVGVTPTITVPASPAPPTNGPPYNVTSELKSLTGPQYAALEAQRLAVPLYYEWTGLAEFSTGALTVQATVPGGVPNTRLVSTGDGLTGGGDLSADRTHSVVADPDGSISVGVAGVKVGILATDAQHGNLGGGGLHAEAVAGVSAGFLSAADKTKLDSLGATDVANIAALTALLDGPLADATQVRVLTLLQPFMLDKTSTAVIDGISVVATNSGVGRWLRQLLPVPKWTDQTAWYVNFGAGNDENVGNLANPLKTIAEFTRRVRVAKYNSTFSPYEIKLQDHVLTANDSFQWGPMIDSGKGALSAALDTGIGTTLVRIRGTKTLGTLGTVAAYTAPVGNAPATITRAVGAFTAGETYEWNGNITAALAGKRFTITDATVPAVGRFNPYQLEGAVPVAGDTFQLVSLTKFGVQLGGYAMPAGARIDIVDCEFPTVANGGVPNYEIQNYILRILNSVMYIFIGGGIGARVRIGGAYTTDGLGATSGSVAIIAPALNAASSVYTVERGYVSPTFVTSLNVIWDILNVAGVFAASRSEFQGGCVRRSGLGAAARSNTSQGPTFCRLDRCRFFDVPSVVVGNPLEGGAGDPGAALIMRRGGWAQINAIVGQSANAGTAGVSVSEGAKLWVHDMAGSPTTVTGIGGLDIVFEGVTNAMPALENYAGANLPALSPMTTWAQWSAAPFSGNVFSYKSGSAIITAA